MKSTASVFDPETLAVSPGCGNLQVNRRSEEGSALATYDLLVKGGTLIDRARRFAQAGANRSPAAGPGGE